MTHKETETVHRHVLALLGLREESILSFGVKATSKFFAFLVELFLLEYFVGKHAEFEVEEVAWLCVTVLLWLVDLVPDVADIGIDDLTNSLKVVATIVKISQHEK